MLGPRHSAYIQAWGGLCSGREGDLEIDARMAIISWIEGAKQAIKCKPSLRRRGVCVSESPPATRRVFVAEQSSCRQS